MDRPRHAALGPVCLSMLQAHLDGMARSVDRVAIGRRVAEQERDLLDLLEPTDGA